MPDINSRPSIDVTIGGQRRMYHAYVTTAPVRLDGPGTLTLHASTLSDLAGFAADAFAPAPAGTARARLVLVDATELTWQRARYRGEQHVLASTDPVLVSLTTLRRWLWRRLAAPPIEEGTT